MTKSSKRVDYGELGSFRQNNEEALH